MKGTNRAEEKERVVRAERIEQLTQFAKLSRSALPLLPLPEFHCSPLRVLSAPPANVIMNKYNPASGFRALRLLTLRSFQGRSTFSEGKSVFSYL